MVLGEDSWLERSAGMPRLMCYFCHYWIDSIRLNLLVAATSPRPDSGWECRKLRSLLSHCCERSAINLSIQPFGFRMKYYGCKVPVILSDFCCHQMRSIEKSSTPAFHNAWLFKFCKVFQRPWLRAYKTRVTLGYMVVMLCWQSCIQSKMLYQGCKP